MYYENKRQFYIKQYGPAVLIVLISIILVISGIYLTLNSNKINNVVVAKNDDEKTVEVNSYTYTNLSENGTVIDIKDVTVIVKTKECTEEINLIGVRKNIKYPDLTNKMKIDLVGKEVTIDYDTQKLIDGKIYGYIFLDNKLYNETLIANGYCELKAERINVNKLDILVQAQILARNKMLGIWEY